MYIKQCFLQPFKSWRNKYLKYITRKEGNKLNLYNKCVEEISQYTGEEEDEVKRKHRLGPENEKDYIIFNKHINPSKEDLDRFYGKCNYYLYELPLWNAECNRPKYLCEITLPYLRCYGYRKVMDFGAGTGDLCLELSQNNLDITYCDIGEKLFDFAKWRFDKRNLPIKMVKGINNIKDKDYECIFSFDAFEHIKNLPLVIEKLVEHILPNGSLIFSGAFSGGTLHLQENEKYNNFMQLNKLMENCGLRFQDKFAQFYFYKKLIQKIK